MVSRREGRRRARQQSGSPEESTAAASAAAAADAELDAPAQPGWPDPLPERLQWMQASLDRVPFTRAEVLALWAKAVRKLRDAAITEISADTALETAYAAGRIGALAVLASRHMRVKARQGHHEQTFSAVAHLGLAGLEELQITSSEVRSDRHGADYAPEEASAEQVAHARTWARATLPAMRAALESGDRVLAAHLAPLP